MNAPWTGAGVTVNVPHPHLPWFGVVVAVPHRRAALSPELMRSLRDWLTGQLADDGVTPPPSDPDRVRLTVDEQRAALRDRSTQDVSEDFRAGLAWCDQALAAIEAAAGGGS